MKLTTLTVNLFLTLIILLIAAGCASPPDAAMQEAEDAITSAVQAGADEFSPKLLDKARVYMSEAKIAYDASDYKDAEDKATMAKMTAEKAEKNSRRMSGHVPGEVPEEEQDME